jgi:hypothetical protein
MKTNSIKYRVKTFSVTLTCLLIAISISAQGKKNLAELLGYPRDSRLLIIHSDDMGLANSVNTATIKAFDNDEMQAISKGHDDYGSLWRQKDLDLVLSRDFQDLIKENNSILIGWKQIRDLMYTEYSK